MQYENKRPYTIGVYQDASGGWRWRLRAGNGRVVADGGESYTRAASAHKAAVSIAEAYIQVLPLPEKK